MLLEQSANERAALSLPLQDTNFSIQVKYLLKKAYFLLLCKLAEEEKVLNLKAKWQNPNILLTHGIMLRFSITSSA